MSEARSVGIPDAAVKVAYDAYISDRGISTGEALRAALVAARPYLMPGVEEIEQHLLDYIYGEPNEKFPIHTHERELMHDAAVAVAALLSTSGESGE